MASKRHLRQRSCTGKRRYDNETDAVRHSESLRKKTGDRRYHAYHCDFCNGWHVGRKPKG